MNIANIFNYLSIDVLPKRHLFQDEKRFNLLPKNDRQEIAPIAHGYLCQLPWSPKFSRTPSDPSSGESHLLQPAVLLARIYCIQSTVLLRKQITQKILSQMKDFPHSSLSVLSAFSETWDLNQKLLSLRLSEMPGHTFPLSPQWSLGKQADVTSIITQSGGVTFHERMTCIIEAGEY